MKIKTKKDAGDPSERSAEFRIADRVASYGQEECGGQHPKAKDV